MNEESLEAAQANVELKWIERARALKPLLEAAAPRIEQAKMMPPDSYMPYTTLRCFG